MFSSIKEYAGVLLKDTGRYRRALTADSRTANDDPSWVHLCNRNETLEVNPNGRGVRCPWRWTSDLHACGVRPDWGRRLAERAFSDWPVSFSQVPTGTGPTGLSFIIAHEGSERQDHVQWVAQSVLAQQDISVECIVVDQSESPSFAERLPGAVRYLHRPRPDGLAGWRKSWAFNQGARESSGDLLVFHDGDIVCPEGYGKALADSMGEFGAASIQRFLFNLSEADTKEFFRTGIWPAFLQPDRVRQNWEGGTIAVRRDAFFELGGYDEAFVGWGGEDNEFFNRCSAVGHLQFGFMPFVHLWHPAQTDKHTTDNLNISHVLDARLAIPAQDRMHELKRRNFGNSQRPDPLTGYRDNTSSTPDAEMT